MVAVLWVMLGVGEVVVLPLGQEVGEGEPQGLHYLLLLVEVEVEHHLKFLTNTSTVDLDRVHIYFYIYKYLCID